MRSMTTAILVAVLALAGCKKSDSRAGGGGSVSPSSGGTAEPAPAAPAGPVALGDLGLKAMLPAGAEVKAGIGGSGVMVMGVGGAAMTVDVASDLTPATIEAAQKDNEMYSPQNVKTETLADGWAITFENSGGMGTNYWVQVRREIGSKAYRCETTASTAEQQAAVLVACKTLQP